MSNPNLFPSVKAIVGGVIDPVVQVPATIETAWIDLGLFEQAMALLSVGTLVASSTVAAKLQQATDDTGAGAKDIAGKAITLLTQAGGDSDKQVKIDVRSDELDVNNDFRFVNLEIVVAAANAPLAAFLLGFEPRYPTDGSVGEELASVDEVVN